MGNYIDGGETLFYGEAPRLKRHTYKTSGRFWRNKARQKLDNNTQDTHVRQARRIDI